MSNSIQVAEFRKRRKQLLIDIMGGKCCLCGYNKCNTVLEFHHINPEEKLYGLSAGGNCHSLEQDLAEAKKCILVCANCHREIHNGLYENTSFITTYNEEFGELLLKAKQEKILQINRCVDCGIEIQKRSTRCVYCESLNRKKQNIIPVSREELKNLIRNYPFTQIAEKFSYTDNAIRKWCVKYNLPKTKKEINSYTDEQWEKI